MSDSVNALERPAAMIATRLGANLAGLAVAIGLFAAIVFATGIFATPSARPTVAAAVPAAVTAAPAPTAAPVVVPTIAPTVAPTIAPTPPPPVAPAVAALAYTNQGRSYVALNIRPGTTISAPFAGRAQVLLYQLINGEIRLNANDRTKPVYPYLTLIGEDKRMIYRLSAQTVDSTLIVEDGQAVGPGDALFKVVGAGPTSWATFYDPGMASQLLVSLAAVPSGRELDPMPFLPAG